MAEYIDRQDAIDFLTSKQLSLDSWGAIEEATGVIDARIIIKGMEAEDVAPVVHAKWIIDDKEWNRIWHCHCSNCKKDPQDYIGGTENWWLVRLPNYCPNCGAKMD